MTKKSNYHNLSNTSFKPEINDRSKFIQKLQPLFFWKLLRSFWKNVINLYAELSFSNDAIFSDATPTLWNRKKNWLSKCLLNICILPEDIMLLLKEQSYTQLEYERTISTEKNCSIPRRV